MEKVLFSCPIDTKALFYGLRNDIAGHTATVSIPMKQGHVTHKELALFQSLPNQIEPYRYSDLANRCLRLSKTATRLNNLFIFKRVYVNGLPVEIGDKAFCTYLKEEIDQSKAQFGRIKLHFPIGLSYSDLNIDIDNSSIMKAVSTRLHDYAFYVRRFDILENDGINFSAVILGPKGISYSKVFSDDKGGRKNFRVVFNEFADHYDDEILAIRSNEEWKNAGPDQYYDACQVEKNKSIEYCERKIDSIFKDANHLCLSKMYPYALYDIQYQGEEAEEYLIIRFTATNRIYFDLSTDQNIFFNHFKEHTQLALVRNALSVKDRKLSLYRWDDMIKLQRKITSTEFSSW